MHMADALLSPAVGGTMWAATAATIVVCSRRLAAERDDRRVPLMGVLGAFLFAAQMVNFAIPGTGSSGHLGGGLLLAILLGPHDAGTDQDIDEVAGRILAVLGKLDREPLEGALVLAGDKPLDHAAREQFAAPELGQRCRGQELHV